MENNDCKRFYGSPLRWDNYEDEYVIGDGDLKLRDKPLEWDTYAEFEAFMESLTKDEALYLGEWSLNDDVTDDSIHIADGLFDKVNFIQLQAKREQESK